MEAVERVIDTIRSLFRLEQLDIRAPPSADTMIVVANRVPYNLHEMGSGFTQFVLTLGNLAAKRPSFILIDEPELNLHPSMQRDLLQSIESFASKGMLFATHNFGLARGSTDQIFGLRALPNSVTDIGPISDCPRLASVVGEMGYWAYRQVGASALLLVEGKGDVRMLQPMLRLYDLEHKIVMIALGGSNYISGDAEDQLAELCRLFPEVDKPIFTLIDSELTSAEADPLPSRQDFRDVCVRLDITCHTLERHSLESYLTDESIRRGFPNNDKPRALGHFEPHDLMECGWKKKMAYLAAREISLDDISGTDLDDFLRSISDFLNSINTVTQPSTSEV